MEHIFWTAFSNKERITATSEIEQIISRYGYITDFTQFSDISLAFHIEVQENRINDLYLALDAVLSLSPYPKRESDSVAERTVMLNITFTQGKGDLRIEVPAVPG